MNTDTPQSETQPNRSMPPAIIIPTLAYPDVRATVEWLCAAFGFTERLRIGDHRAQLMFGNGSLIVTQEHGSAPAESRGSHTIMVRVADVDGHHAHAQQSGAEILTPPTDYSYGERQYVVRDIGGHVWTFSQTVADIDPASWGGVLMTG
jgi:uncharacterized glyoxalase superfamily protein PhnB